MFRFYFPLFIKLFMVLLCVIFKREWYLRAARARGILSTPACDVYVLLKTTGAAIKIARGATVLTIKKINIIRWNMYRDNNFHSRRKVLRVKCLCSKNHESGKHKLIYVLKKASRSLLFFKMNSRQENCWELSSYSQNHNYILRNVFFIIAVKKRLKGFLNLILL